MTPGPLALLLTRTHTHPKSFSSGILNLLLTGDWAASAHTIFQPLLHKYSEFYKLDFAVGF